MGPRPTTFLERGELGDRNEFPLEKRLCGDESSRRCGPELHEGRDGGGGSTDNSEKRQKMEAGEATAYQPGVVGEKI